MKLFLYKSHCNVGTMQIQLLIITCTSYVSFAKDENSASDFGDGLISSLRNDANLDLPVDEEYEDLRAQLFAYHSALASLEPSRRSMLTTQCWRRGGICIDYKLCPGYRQLTEIPGCMNRHNVCCFVWNQYEIRELRDHGIGNQAFPWKIPNEFGGQGVQQITTTRKSKKKKATKNTSNEKKKYTQKMKNGDKNLQDFSRRYLKDGNLLWVN